MHTLPAVTMPACAQEQETVRMGLVDAWADVDGPPMPTSLAVTCRVQAMHCSIACSLQTAALLMRSAFSHTCESWHRLVSGCSETDCAALATIQLARKAGAQRCRLGLLEGLVLQHIVAPV